MNKYTQQELDSILEQHKLWLENQGGERAQLRNADLSNPSASKRRPAHLT